MASNVTELSADQVRRACDPSQFTFTTTEELPSLAAVIGQERALRSILFGIDIDTSGYHMYALGPTGTGKTTIVQKFLEHEAATRPVPDDWLYFNNFQDADHPRALRLPAGIGSRFKNDMDQIVDYLTKEIPRVFESTEYGKQQEELDEEFQKRRQTILEQVEKAAQEKGLTLVPTPQGIMLAPVIRGTVLTPDQMQLLGDEQRQKIEAAQEEIQAKLRDAMREIQQIQKEARGRGDEIDRQIIGFAISHLFDEMREKYAQFDVVLKFLNEVQHDLMENVQTLKQYQQLQQLQAEQGPMALMLGRAQLTFDQYRVNLIVNNSETKGAPAILARNPSYNNLVGRIEHQGQFGTLVTNFNMIKGGLLHKANGGYLLLDVRDVLTKPLAWEGLKRALKNKVIEIESLAEAYGMFATRTLEPEPIPLHLKVILIGDPMIYYLLFNLDPDFQELFKVKADFSLRMERTPETTEQYAQFIATVCREENLTHFAPTGVAQVVEHSSRLVEHQGKLITKFGDIVDLIRESSYWAGKNGHQVVQDADVRKAIDEKVYRSNQIQLILQEMITEGTILIDTHGETPGQINGLAVLSLGDYAFGKPSRITARIHVGNKGVINIDRETELGGKIHNKGSMILAGYLGGKFATDVPLALSATLTFEQVYEEIEGDSASSVELYALLSALSGFPIRQDLAVTGSVNQLGQVQAIGGVNVKIEGFFDVCCAIGLTGQQGVMIPQSNVKHLMLREDVVAAIHDGQFHIYPIASIDEGIALLTGKEAGERQADGTYPDGTVNGAVQRKLRALALAVKEFMHSEDEHDGKKDS